MFYDREDCIKVSYFPDDYGTQSGVFLFKGFYTDEECKVIENAVSPKIEANSDVYKDTLINWYADKASSSETAVYLALFASFKKQCRGDTPG